MKINGINLPNGDNRGRLFPYKDHGPHYLGPCVVNGVVYVCKMWINTNPFGTTYYRMVFESPEDNPQLVE